MVFSTTPGMLKHRKLKHLEEVKECFKFQEGTCGFSDYYCWNKHTVEVNIHIKNSHRENVSISKQDFHKSPQNLAPPGN